MRGNGFRLIPKVNSLCPIRHWLSRRGHEAPVKRNNVCPDPLG